MFNINEAQQLQFKELYNIIKDDSTINGEPSEYIDVLKEITVFVSYDELEQIHDEYIEEPYYELFYVFYDLNYYELVTMLLDLTPTNIKGLYGNYYNNQILMSETGEGLIIQEI